MLVANPAPSSDMPKRSINYFGAVRLVPTSIPTWQTMPKNESNSTLSANRAIHSLNEEVFTSSLPFSSILVIHKHCNAMMAIIRKRRNRSFQLPNDTAAHPAIIGARNEAIALINCPNVNELAKRSPLTMLDNNGFNETCINVFPIPKKEKDTIIMAME